MKQCVMCDKAWDEFDRRLITIHYADDHQGNLMFLSDEEVELMVDEIA